MSRIFDDILNDCLERISEGEEVQRCIDRYPGHAEELAPLLRVAVMTIGVASSTVYTSDAKARGLNRLIQTVQENGVPKRRRFAIPTFSQPLLRPLVVAFVAVFLVSVAATGTTMASSNSVPGDPLYWVKTTKESVSLHLMRAAHPITHPA